LMHWREAGLVHLPTDFSTFLVVRTLANEGLEGEREGGSKHGTT
jgi:hypothetical protein